MADAKPPADIPETLRTEAPEPRRPSLRDISTFKPPEQRFALGEELGRGGMGKVVAARDVSLRRGVAIKQMLSNDAADLERFEREVRITAELEHPSIVAIHDVGVDDQGRPYYVMRQIQGEPLASRLANLTTLRARLALLPKLLAVADAAAFAHARKIIHRDIKPANILLGEFGETLLIDWGLARRLDEAEATLPDAAHSLPDEPLTIAGHIYGTAGYMSPEQARGAAVDTTTDVYALGATLFHILVGRGPFDGMSADARIEAAHDLVPAPLHELPQDTPTELRAIVSKAMATHGELRYPDAGALAADLRAFLEGQFVGAHQYTVGERARRFVRRHRAALAVGLIAAVAVLIVAVAAIQRVIDKSSDARIADAEASMARVATEDREQRILLEQASLLAETDPARAIARLRHLPETSAYWARAHDIAAKAVMRGIPRGDHVHKDLITAVALSPDHTRIASADRTGKIVVRTLGNQISARVTLGAPTFRAAWIDDRTVMAATPDGLATIDAITGKVGWFARGTSIGPIVLAAPGLPWFIDEKKKELVELTLSTGAMRVLARDTEFVRVVGSARLIAGPAGIRWLRPDREILLSPTPPAHDMGLAISNTPHTAAAIVDGEVVQWDESGAETKRWKVSRPMRLFYGARWLYVQTMLNTFRMLGPETRDLLVNRTRIIDAPATKLGLAVTLDTGRINLVEGDSSRTFPIQMTDVTRMASAPDSTVIILGSQSGEVQWWDLAEAAPVMKYVGNFSPCGVDERNVYLFVNGDEVVAVDRVTLASRTISKFERLTIATCIGVLSSGKIVLHAPDGGYMIDIHSAEVWRHPGWIAMDASTDSILYGSGPELLQLEHGVGTPRVVWTAPEVITEVLGNARWLAVRLADNRLVRLDRETGTTVTITDWPGWHTPAPNGDIWYAVQRWLFHWSERGPIPVGSFPEPIALTGGDGDPLFIQLRDKTTLLVRPDRTQGLSNVGALLAVGDDRAVFNDNEHLVVLGLKSGERIEIPIPDRAVGAAMQPGGRIVFVKSGSGWLMIYEDRVPDDPAKLRAWLDTATNATLDKDLGVLTWRTN